LFSQASHNSRLSPIDPVPGSTEVVTRVNELIADLRPDNADLLEAFHRIQHEFGHIPREAVPLLAGKFRTTPAIIFGTIDFYSEIHLRPPAEHVVEWCSGPACLLKGSMKLRRALEATLGCYMNQASAGGRFELRLVQCDGACHLAPLIRYRGRYLGPLTTSAAIEWARALKEGAAPAGERAAVAEAAARAETPSRLSPRPAAGPGEDPTREPGA
jgi:NADH:ubiquinone oxidoreductase subunit E